MTDTPYKTPTEAAAGVGNSRSELLNQREAADFLRLSPRTLERLRVVSGGPLFARLGRRVVYRLSDLENWIAERVVGSTSEPVVEEAERGSQ